MSSKIVDSSTYIKEMQDPKDWQTAMENETRPVLIQAGASWCGPCQVLKPQLLDAVKEHNGAVEYLYVDVDKHSEIAQMLQIQSIPICYIVKKGELIDSMTGVPRDGKKGIEAFI